MGKETTKGKGGWFPSIIGPNELFARNKANGTDEIVPTPYYDKKDMPVFRKLGNNDAEGDY